MSVIGLVTEGPTDQVVIEHLLRRYAQSQNIEGDWTCRELQPLPPSQALGGNKRGWTQVRQWCLEHPRGWPPRPLFASNMDTDYCDRVIIHLDADLLDKDPGNRSLRLPGTEMPSRTATPAERGNFLRNLLHSWLCQEGETLDLRRTVLAPAVEAIETWLVAGLCDDAEPESNHDVALRLGECDSLAKSEKSVDNYQRLAEHAGKQIHRITERCPHFRTLAEAVFP
ncbi:MAG: hypothetical protein HQL87_15310 [Magnetococcales bacterium]|nr:hypothetical protein [Magnetococcales bacterium]